jgi:tripartite ATP-independent transporter DctP family solute receptor
MPRKLNPMLSRRQFAGVTAIGVGLIARSSFAANTRLRFGHMWPASSVWGKGAQRFADLLNQKTNGHYTVRVYPDGQLGAERDMEEGLGVGNLDCTFGGSDVLTQFEPKMGIFTMPFLFPDYAHANAVMDGPIGEEVFNALRTRAGIRVIGSGAQGFRDVLTKKPINSMADMKDVKIRVPESDVMLKLFRALGANPVSVPWTQTYMSAKSGVIDGLEGVPEVLLDFKMYEVGKYVAKTGHILATLQLLVSDKVYQGLPPDVQKAMDDAGHQAWDEARTAAQAGNETALTKMGSLGEHFTTPDLTPFKEAVRPFLTDWAKANGATALLDRIQQAAKT